MQFRVKHLAGQKTHRCIIQISVVWMKGKRFNIVVRSVSCVFNSTDSLVIQINITRSCCFEALICLCCHTPRSLQRSNQCE